MTASTPKSWLDTVFFAVYHVNHRSPLFPNAYCSLVVMSSPDCLPVSKFSSSSTALPNLTRSLRSRYETRVFSLWPLGTSENDILYPKTSSRGHCPPCHPYARGQVHPTQAAGMFLPPSSLRNWYSLGSPNMRWPHRWPAARHQNACKRLQSLQIIVFCQYCLSSVKFKIKSS